MLKDFLKLLLYESIVMLVLTIVASLTGLIQMAFGKKTGTYSSFVFSGTYYEYNVFMYLLGLAIYIFVMITIIKKLGAKLDDIKELGIAYKIIVCIYDLLWGFVMYISLMMFDFLVLGLTNSYKPEVLLMFYYVGVPVITTLGVGSVLIRKTCKAR